MPSKEETEKKTPSSTTATGKAAANIGAATGLKSGEDNKKEPTKEKAPALSQDQEDMKKLKEHIRMVGIALGDPVEGEHKNIAERRAWAGRVVKLLEKK